MREIIKPALVLFAVCVITTVTLAGVKSVTQGTIDARTAADLEQAKRDVLPQAMSFEEIEPAKVAEVKKTSGNEFVATVQQVFVGKDASGTNVGFVYKMQSRGYDAAGIKMTMGIDASGVLMDIKIIEQIETPGLGTNVLVPSGQYMTQYRGKTFTGALNLIKTSPVNPEDIQAVAGATITSRAIYRAVQGGLEFGQALTAMGGNQ